MNTIAMLLPPTAVGVIADVNSQSMHTLNDCSHDKSPSVSRLYLHMYPISRPASAAKASVNPANTVGVRLTACQSKLANSSQNSHATTAMPIITGIATYAGRIFIPFCSCRAFCMCVVSFKPNLMTDLGLCHSLSATACQSIISHSCFTWSARRFR